MRARARVLAVRALDDVVEIFVGCGFRSVERRAGAAVLERDAARLRVAMTSTGRVFGGSYVLEIATADAPLEPSAGIVGKGRGAVRLARIAFRGRRGDAAGARLAAALEADADLQDALARVHFERIRVEPDGRPVIRHLGGSVVWILFPPLVRPVPLVPEQAEATARALAAFSRVTA
jgi:hypothetical protein